MQIRNAGTKYIPVIHKLAKAIWPVSYKDVITAGQIEYMLGLMYSQQALTNQIEMLGHQFILVYDDSEPLGFASFSPKHGEEKTTYRLHKLYVLPSLQGKGLGKMMIAHIENELIKNGAALLELNVNKRNPAYHFYLKNGFTKLKDEVIDIGNGYIMDDFVMIKHVK